MLPLSKSKAAWIKQQAIDDLILEGQQDKIKWFDTHNPLPLDQLGTGLELYCPSEKCKRKLASTPKPTIKDINGKLQISGLCAQCGKGISSFVSKKKQVGGSVPDLSQPQYNIYYRYPGIDINNADYSRLWKHPPWPHESWQAYQDRIEYLYSNTVPYHLISNFYGMMKMDALNRLNQKGRPPPKLEPMTPQRIIQIGKEIRKEIHDNMP